MAACDVGELAPDFTLTDTEGASVQLSSFRTGSASTEPGKRIHLVFNRGFF